MIGNAAIPEQMWIHQGQRWDDAYGMASCADKNNEVVDALLRVSAAAVLKMSVPAWIRINLMGAGHLVRWRNGARVFEHQDGAADIDPADLEWAIETVARAALALEQDWPDLVLQPADDADEPDARLRYLPVRLIARGLPRG
jgi:hypothetical protein